MVFLYTHLYWAYIYTVLWYAVCTEAEFRPSRHARVPSGRILQRRKALVENPWKFHAKSQMNTAPLTSVAAERGEKKERNVSSQNAAP